MVIRDDDHRSCCHIYVHYHRFLDVSEGWLSGLAPRQPPLSHAYTRD